MKLRGGGEGGTWLYFLVSENHGSVLPLKTSFNKFYPDLLITWICTIRVIINDVEEIIRRGET